METFRELIEIDNTEANPAADTLIVDCCLAFLNGATIRINDAAKYMSKGEEWGEDGVLYQWDQLALAAERLEANEADRPIRSLEQLKDEQRRVLRQLVVESLEDRARISALYVKEHYANKAAVLPCLHLDDAGNARLVMRFELPDDIALAMVGALLLIDPHRPFYDKLCQCQWEPCSKLFLEIKPPLGRPQRRYCSAEHLADAHKARGPERMKQSRDNRKRVARRVRAAATGASK